jgi:hypothetical protein
VQANKNDLNKTWAFIVYKQLEVNTNRSSFLCGNRNGSKNVKSHNRTTQKLTDEQHRPHWKDVMNSGAMIILWHVWDRVSKLSYRNWLYIWVTWRVSYKKQELLTLCELPSSSRLFSGVCVAHLLIFVLSDYATSRSYFRYDYRIKTMIGSCLPPVPASDKTPAMLLIYTINSGKIVLIHGLRHVIIWS